MGHCRGGDRTLDQFDLVTPLVQWVEERRAPAQIPATGASMPGVSRPLCPYPQLPHYSGRGDINSAANFSCRN
jgi:feruloyl esterase